MAERPRISQDASTLEASYDIVIIGSGYGGSIAAGRLGEYNRDQGLNLRIAVLERGREWGLGEFPETPDALAKAVRNSSSPNVQQPLGLFDLRTNGDVHTLTASGLGGSSLTDSGILSTPDVRTWEQEGWPEQIRKDMEYGSLERCIDTAKTMLGASWRPSEGKFLERVGQMAKAAGLAGGKVERIEGRQHDFEYAINFGDVKTNDQGMPMGTCTQCGACATGCNAGAKVTLAETYLALARHGGVLVYTGAEVRTVDREEDGTFVLNVYQHNGGAVNWSSRPPGVQVRARLVVLAAGPLGSTELLLRSKEEFKATGRLKKADQPTGPNEMAFPGRIGKAFGRNGNVLGICAAGAEVCDSVGLGSGQPAVDWISGPTVGGAFEPGGMLQTLRDTRFYHDFAFPPGLVEPLHEVLPGRSGGLGSMFGLFKKAATDRKGSINHALPFLMTGHDEHDGMLGLDNEKVLKTRWQSKLQENVFKIGRDQAKTFAQNLGGRLVTSIEGAPMDLEKLTIQPLGGLVVGANRRAGAVNCDGELFGGGSKGNETVRNFYVIGSELVPTSLGCAPALAVAGLCERIVEKLIKRLKNGEVTL